jgi:hypothetical protein
MSSFKSKNLFGSGPHRFSQLKQGQLLIGVIQFDQYSPATVPFGLVELDVVVTGRLVAGTDAALWALRDAVVAELEETPTAGVLVGNDGRSWAQMSFVRFEEGDRTDRGRLRSVAYTATFRRFLGATMAQLPPQGGGT